ncbi:type II secretion system minor pseudopilin GspK [Roseateles koreensis]|uniref:Type II secretion system protein K n=1 Tax=Roseateles koreensis TaxID=2987526 RepID=A0ABT5KRB1_9BURK|nr:type II secretion system minor pseudopilin GspK [Roseateles koreensis]MDC8785459.1 type II secretion system minor pseudopilin GspK [Roseateles koreensis]
MTPPPFKPPVARRPHQSGAALLTAMIIVTLVASLAAAMVWRQYRAVQIESAERARAQSALMLRGALDWARLILREDAVGNRTTPTDNLNEVWAVPVAEGRISTFLALDGNDTNTGPEAYLSGSITDAQAQYNLRNLTGGAQVAPLEQRTLERLCESAQAPPGTAALIIAKLRSAFPVKVAAGSSGNTETTTSTSSDVPLQPQNLDQLAWFGLSEDTLNRLRPFVTLLPTATPVNLNTAPREVIAGVLDGVDLASAQRLVQARQSTPLKSPQEAKNYLPSSAVLSAERVNSVSAYFIVRGRMRLDERVMEERSLVQRRDLDVLIIDRERVNRVLDGRADKP